jgi:hypothetical protein
MKTVSKQQLLEKRAELIQALAAVVTVGDREVVQADLAIVNARLKQLHIEEGRALKAAADARNAAGQAEQRENLARAAARLPPVGTKTKIRPGGFDAPVVVPEPQRARPHLTRGEFLLKNARQALKTIDTIKPEHRLPHTHAFREALVAYLVEQKKHVADFAARGADALTVSWPYVDGNRVANAIGLARKIETAEAPEADWQKTWKPDA